MSKTISVKADGQLNISVDSKLFQTIRNIHTWYTKQGFAWFMLPVLALVDIFGFLQIAEATISAKASIRIMIIVGFTASFELAPLYIGYSVALKVYNLGTEIRRIVFWLSLAAFILGVLLNGAYRFLTMDIAYAIESPSGGATITDEVALPLTILLSVMPLITSLVNMVVGCLSFDPLLFDIMRIRKKIAVLNEKKRQIDSVISELQDDTVKDSRISDAKAKLEYATFELASAQTRLKNYIRTQLNIANDHHAQAS